MWQSLLFSQLIKNNLSNRCEIAPNWNNLFLQKQCTNKWEVQKNCCYKTHSNYIEMHILQNAAGHSSFWANLLLCLPCPWFHFLNIVLQTVLAGVMGATLYVLARKISQPVREFLDGRSQVSKWGLLHIKFKNLSRKFHFTTAKAAVIYHNSYFPLWYQLFL